MISRTRRGLIALLAASAALFSSACAAHPPHGGSRGPSVTIVAPLPAPRVIWVPGHWEHRHGHRHWREGSWRHGHDHGYRDRHWDRGRHGPDGHRGRHWHD